MERWLQDLLDGYDAAAPLPEAFTLPAPFYTDGRVAERERRAVFQRSWQVVGRAEQVAVSGQYLTAAVGGEPVVVVRGGDGVLRAFFNVCRHHAAQVMTAPCGQAAVLRCPYHGWTYSLSGELHGTPDFGGVCHFERADFGLVPLEVAVWERFVFVRVDGGAGRGAAGPSGPSLRDFLGAELQAQVAALGLGRLRHRERRRYELGCNWKVFVDNYLDGGYHVPHLHAGLSSVLRYSQYQIEVGARHCLQSSPLSADAGDAETATAAVRGGERAMYFWLYPNFMINWYEGAMDTNLVVPLAVDRTAVIFDYYFAGDGPEATARSAASIAVSERIQDEDVAICESVQRGLGSRAYGAGRLSVRREAGEHLFHRLLHADLSLLP